MADLLYITTLPLWIDYFLQHDDWIHGQESCKLFGFIFYTNIYVSIAFLCCISLDRYLAVAYPMRFAKIRRIKTGTFKNSVKGKSVLKNIQVFIMFIMFIYSMFIVYWEHFLSNRKHSNTEMPLCLSIK